VGKVNYVRLLGARPGIRPHGTRSNRICRVHNISAKRKLSSFDGHLEVLLGIELNN
jgi:hypothetical protein